MDADRNDEVYAEERGREGCFSFCSGNEVFEYRPRLPIECDIRLKGKKKRGEALFSAEGGFGGLWVVEERAKWKLEQTTANPRTRKEKRGKREWVVVERQKKTIARSY